jgi:hypothetical protein
MKEVFPNEKEFTAPESGRFLKSIARKKRWQPPTLTEVDCKKTYSGLDGLMDDGLAGYS